MTRKLLIILATFSLASFALAACGDDEESTDAGTDTGSTVESTVETDPSEDPGGGATSGGTIEVEADPNGSLAFATGDLTTSAGEVTIEFTNDSSTPHDVQISGETGTIGGTDVVSGETTTATVELEAGDYTYFCSVSGHQTAGMEAGLTVE